MPSPARPSRLPVSLRWALAVASVAVAAALTTGPGGERLFPEVPERFVHGVTLLFSAAVLSAWLGGMGPGLLAAFLAAVVIDWFITPPALLDHPRLRLRPAHRGLRAVGPPGRLAERATPPHRGRAAALAGGAGGADPHPAGRIAGDGGEPLVPPARRARTSPRGPRDEQRDHRARARRGGPAPGPGRAGAGDARDHAGRAGRLDRPRDQSAPGRHR